MKRALITGITGQDGSYLAEQLLSKGYEVHGLVRRASTFNRERIEHIYLDPDAEPGPLHLHYGELGDGSRLTQLVYEIRPDEIYHLAAQSHVRVSFDIPESTADGVALGTIRLLEALRSSGSGARFYQASSSEMFGSSAPPQSETTPFRPRSPYAASKLMAYWLALNYRESYGLFIANGILFNHESPRRAESFVTRKITKALVRIKAGRQGKLLLGNLEARRDWGYAPEYVDAMWRMLQQDLPGDYVVATGEMHSVREFLDVAGDALNLDWHEHVEVDPRYLRPTEVDALCGDASRARLDLSWQPTTQFRELVRIMVDADQRLLDDTLAGRAASTVRDDALFNRSSKGSLA